MATTDPLLAHRAVTALFRSGAPLAVLHGEDRLARFEPVTDVDLVSGLLPIELVRSTESEWSRMGLHPIIFWPYDVGGTATVFLTTPRANEGVQLDILHDPAGQGQYGLYSGRLLDHLIQGEQFPRLDHWATLAYTARKRLVKGEIQAFRAAWHPDSRQGERAARHVLAEGAVQEMISGRFRARPWISTARVARAIRRLARPIGAWAHIFDDRASSEVMALELERRFSRILPHVHSSQLPQPGPRLPGWWASHVAPVRWRPGVYFSWSARSSVRADIAILRPLDVEDAAQQTVSSLQARIF
ncbi:hypothetical protein BH23ACT4_BH23ACT4_09790 [soil metagenome]